MTKECSHTNCSNQTFEQRDRCALHCTKSDYQTDKLDGLLSDFDQLLNLHIFLDLTKDSGISDHELFELLTAIQLNGFDKESKAKLSILRKQSFGTLFLRGIVFPYSDARDQYDYIRTLDIFQSIHFADCHFMPRSLRLDNKEVFFEFCHFNSLYTVNNKHQILENERNCVYSLCTFEKSVSIVGHEDKKQRIDFVAFDGCEFQEELKIFNIEANTSLIQLKDKDEYDMTDERNKNHIPTLRLENCVLNQNIELNYLISEKIEIKNTKFESKLEIKGTKAKQLNFLDSNVKGIFDAFGSTFEKTHVEKSIFHNFAGFEKVTLGAEQNTYEKVKSSIVIDTLPILFFIKFIFEILLFPVVLISKIMATKKEQSKNSKNVKQNKNADDEKNKKAIFKYVTFEDFSNFRDAKFNSGLDLATINLKENPNFLNVTVNQRTTNRETFRIIKHSFDAIGNKIEANHFYVQEMKAYEKEVFSTWGNCLNKFILLFSHLTSNFGSNYLIPTLWLITLFILKDQGCFVLIMDSSISQRIIESLNSYEYISLLNEVLNDFALNLPIYGKIIQDYGSSYPFFYLIYHIFSGVLIWQIGVAMRRKVSR